MLQEARRTTARAAALGGPEPDLTPEGLAAALEADAGSRAALDAAARERLRRDPPEAPPGTSVRSLRRARSDEVHHAVDALILAGELVADGPGRLRLPGFGPSTWRSMALLVRDPDSAAAAWARAVASSPLEDLGDAAPAALRAPAPAPGLRRAALGLLAIEAERQDLRDALIRAEDALATTRERGDPMAAREIAAECGAMRRAIVAADAAAARRWEEGVRMSGAGPLEPGTLP